jgi:hypothetical protein
MNFLFRCNIRQKTFTHYFIHYFIRKYCDQNVILPNPFIQSCSFFEVNSNYIK